MPAGPVALLHPAQRKPPQLYFLSADTDELRPSANVGEFPDQVWMLSEVTRCIAATDAAGRDDVMIG